MPLSKMLEDYRTKKREFPTYDELAAIASHEPCADPIVERNVSLLRQRSTVGVQKYGTTLADNKLPLRAWLNHALEEVLDQANYLQAAMAEIDSAERALPPLPQYFPDVTNIRADEELRAQQYAQDYARSALASAPVQTGTSRSAINRSLPNSKAFSRSSKCVARTAAVSQAASITIADTSSWTWTMTCWPSLLCKPTLQPAPPRIPTYRRIW